MIIKSKVGMDFDVPLRGLWGTLWGTSKSITTLLFMSTSLEQNGNIDFSVTIVIL